MKIKFIAAACAALCATSAFAGTALDPNTPVAYQTYYMAGATAQLPGVAIVVPQSLFDPATPVTWIYQGTAANPNPAGPVTFPANPAGTGAVSAGNNVMGWYGMASAATGTSGPLLVIYNQNAGSMTGLVQLLNTQGANPTSFLPKWTKVLTVGNGGSLFTCASQPSSAGPTNTCYTADATHDVYTPVSIALSDVYATENAGVLTPGSNGQLALSKLTQVTTGLEGFGVIVNPALYLALQTAQGLTPGLGGASQPNINSADYASLISVLGNESSSAADFIQDPANPSDNTALYIERRTNWSGTQSASDIFFLNALCNTAAGTFQSPIDLGPQTGTFGPVLAVGGTNTFIAEQAGTGGVKNALTLGKAGQIPVGSYGIGVVSLENTPAQNANNWQFVKLDGVSPDWIKNADGTYTYDATHRASMLTGAYKFAVEMNAYYLTNSSNALKKLDALIVKQLTDSTLHNLTGVAYLDPAINGQQARYSRYGSNCAPMTNQNF